MKRDRAQCENGHPRPSGNTYPTRTGKRGCHQCRAEFLKDKYSLGTNRAFVVPALRK